MQVLLIEDNQDLAANVGEYLEADGCAVDFATDGIAGMRRATDSRYDVVILDLNLRGMDGLTLCRRLRNQVRSDVPVLMLTARDADQDVVAGLEAGADDYLTKPFALSVLAARLKALLRRARNAGTTLQVDDLEFDTGTLTVRRGERRIPLTPTGLRMLEALMRASPSVVRRAQLERQVWADRPPESNAALRVHIRALRAAIDGDGEAPLLHTIHGIGYRLCRTTDR